MGRFKEGLLAIAVCLIGLGMVAAVQVLMGKDFEAGPDVPASCHGINWPRG